MAERAGPQVYSIAAHRGFADALVAGLIPLGLAMQKTAAAAYLAEQVMTLVRGGPPILVVLAVAVLSTVFSLLMSNVGAITVLTPAAATTMASAVVIRMRFIPALPLSRFRGPFSGTYGFECNPDFNIYLGSKTVNAVGHLLGAFPCP